jgi:hypothetical protein
MNKLNIFFTIDTELWLHYDSFQENLNSAIYGKTKNGNFGLEYQLKTFEKYDLQAYFFVEPLFTLRYGKEALETIISLIQKYNQNIGLHIHSEWLTDEDYCVLSSPRCSYNIKDYSFLEQSQIIKKGLSILKECGAKSVNSFRAGNYGGNIDTLHALKANNIKFDTTYNFPYLNSDCGMKFNTTLRDTTHINGVYEFPVTYFNDIGSHPRHLQLTACSLSELKFVLKSAWKQQRNSCTIVLHSFEWIRRHNKNNQKSHDLDEICLKRFEKLCQFIAHNQDKYNTPAYGDAIKNGIDSSPSDIQSNILRTAGRLIKQIQRKIYK